MAYKLVSAQEMVKWKAYAKFYSRVQVVYLKIHSSASYLIRDGFKKKYVHSCQNKNRYFSFQDIWDPHLHYLLLFHISSQKKKEKAWPI